MTVGIKTPFFAKGGNDGSFPPLEGRSVWTRSMRLSKKLRVKEYLFTRVCPGTSRLITTASIPTITTATPAYEYAMDQANLDMACRTKYEWNEKLLKYMNNETARRQAGEKGKAYTESYFSDEMIVDQWDNLIESVLE